ncbi:MAG: hypothetical protein ACI8ZF_000793 [Candidatus Midichloriaceae bacterium]|jgi:hypothetical protein
MVCVMSGLNFIDKLRAGEDIAEHVVSCLEALSSGLGNVKKTVLLERIVEKLGQEYGVGKDIKELENIVHTVITSVYKIYEDIEEKNYLEAAADFGDDMVDSLPEIIEGISKLIPVAEEVYKDVSTGGVHLLQEGVEGAAQFVERAVVATCDVVDALASEQESASNSASPEEL